MMKKKLDLFVWAAALIAIACGLLFYENALLWKIQEMNLFLTTSLFFKQQMVVAGGFLTYVGTFLTQFLYHPWLGVLLLCACWWLLLWLTKRTFCVPAKWSPLLLLLVALLLLTIVDQGYWVYMLKLRGHFFVSTLGTIAVVALLWGFRALPSRWGLRALWLVFTCAVGYPLLGIYALAATLLMALWSWRIDTKGNSSLYMVLALIAVVGVPLVCYRYVYHEMNLANIYYAELPLYFITKDYHAYYIPYYLLAICFLLLTLVPLKGNPRPKHSKRWMGLQAVVLAVLVAGVVFFWYKDENYHRELSMQYLIEQQDWEGVIKEAKAQKDEPTRAIVMMQNLALSRLGRQGNEMYYYPNGSKKSNAPFDVRMMQVVGMLIYYQYGMLNYCNRLCTEMGVEYDWRTEYYKNMIRCAVLEGDKPVARKYIAILKHTLFYDDWAGQMEQLLEHPDQIAKNAEMEPITHMLHYNNQLTSDQGFVERCLMYQLVNSTYTGDPIFQEQCLLAALWVKDKTGFWYHFGNYVKLHPNDPMPLHYQEAAYLFGTFDNRPNLDKMPFSQATIDGYKRFMEVASRYEDQDVDETRKELYPMLGNTYYFDYYLMFNLPQY